MATCSSPGGFSRRFCETHFNRASAGAAHDPRAGCDGLCGCGHSDLTHPGKMRVPKMSYCEIPEFFDSNWPIARKEHKCCECRGIIRKGEVYGRFTGKWHGDPPKTYKQHLLCEWACNQIRDNFLYDECVPFGYLFEETEAFEVTDSADRKNKDTRKLRRTIAAIKWRLRGQERRAKA